MNKPQGLLRERLCAAIAKDAQTKKIIYLSGHMGWGKTTEILQYLAFYSLPSAILSGAKDGWLEAFEQAILAGTPHIVLDDLQEIHEPGQKEKLTQLLVDAPYATRFYLIGRTDLPPYLKLFSATNQLTVYGTKQLALTEGEAEQLLALRGLSCSRPTLQKILEATKGWCMGTIFAAQQAQRAGGFTEQAKQLATLDIYDCMDTALWERWNPKLQSFLLSIGHLEHFTEKEACIVCGKQSVSEPLEHILSTGSFLVQDENTCYHFYPIFHEYLMRQQKRLCTPEFMVRRYQDTGLYFALNGDAPQALHYYHLAGDKEKTTEILLENANSHPGDVYFYDLEQYYLELDHKVVEQSPEMLCALSMLHSLSMRTEESIAYRKKLEEMERSLPGTDPRKRIAKEKLAFLTLGLPHEGSGNMIEKLKKLSTLNLPVQRCSITGNMPSILNGGLDFCEWSKKDRFMYATLKPIVNLVLGSYAKGLPEVAMGESLFEKCWDSNFSESLMLVNSGKAASNNDDYQQLNFSANALMARMFVSQGSLATALELMVQFRGQAVEHGKWQLLQNVDAFLVWLRLLENDDVTVNEWFDRDAPNELEHFYILERYRYLVKVKLYIVHGMYLQALSLLDQLEHYFTEYARTYNYMEARLLRSIVLYRMGSPDWETVLQDVLTQCEGYRFIRIVSDLGAGIFELLQKLPLRERKGYYANLLTATKRQAVLYPHYLTLQRTNDYSLTETEITVLRLLSKGLSNAEIGKLLDIGLSTVKTHTGNIYSKLGVKGRMAAVKLAEEQELL